MNQSLDAHNPVIVDQAILVQHMFEKEIREAAFKLNLYKAMDLELLLVENMEKMLAQAL